jgi:molecular chaperone HtpG
MQKDQEKIYYVIADTFKAAQNSPHLEIFRKKGIEVLLLSDRIDEWLVSHLTEFEGKSLQSVAKGDLDLGKIKTKDKTKKEDAKKEDAAFESMLKQMKDILGDKVKEVRLTDRLTDSPACLVSDENEMSIHLQNMLKSAGQDFPANKPIVEINPEHPLVNRLKTETDEERFSEWTYVLFDQAQLAQGTPLEDPATFVKRLNKLLVESTN